MKRNNTYTRILLFSLVLSGLFSACEKNLEIEAESSTALGLAPDKAIKSAQDLQYMLNSCYDNCANMMNGSMQITADALGDDIQAPTNKEPFLTAIYNRHTDQFNSISGGVFSEPYFTIYRANTMDLYYDNVSISATEKDRMKGETSFLRALCHFELAKLFAQPYGYTSDNSHLGMILRTRARNEAIPRSTVAETYALIISDLQQAIAKLPATNGVYATSWAAKALLAKVYFQMGRYTDALPLLTDVINNGGFLLSDSLNRFKRSETATEIIFGFVCGDNVYENGNRAAAFKDLYRNDQLDPATPPYLLLSSECATLLNDTNDKRSKLVRVYNAGTADAKYTTTKFNQTTFATPYLTLTDMILMKAEALAITNNNVDALAEITKIINRSYYDPAPVLANISNPGLLENIRIERRKEMVCEGDRVNQLKRIGADLNRGIGSGSVKVRGADWNCNGMVLQFPSSCGTSNVFVFNPLTVCN